LVLWTLSISSFHCLCDHCLLMATCSVSVLVDFVERNQIVQYVLRDNAHHELIKRCQIVLHFLAQRGRIDEHYIDTIWSWSIVLAP